MALSETFGYEPVSTASLGFDDATLARRARLITQAMPSLKKTPNMVLKLASLNVEDDGLVRAVRRGKLFDDVRVMKFQLETQGNFEQREAWKQMSRKSRALLRATGYQGPEERGFWENPDWLNRFVRRDMQQFQDWFITPRKEVADKAERKIGKALGRVDDTIEESRAGGAYGWTKEAIGDAAGGVGDVLGPPASAVWQGFLTGAQFPSHLYRYTKEMEVDRNASGMGIFLPWGFDSDAWEETGTQMGEGYFPDYIHDRVDKILEDEAEAFWAKRMAGGDTVADLAGLYGDPGSDRYQAYYRRISEVSSSLRFQQATRTLELGKVSFGRVVANGLFTPGSEPWDMTSGLFDLAFTLVLDPYLVLGKVAKAVKVFRYSAETLEDLNRINKAVEAAGNTKLGVNWVEDIKTMPMQQVRATLGPEGAHMEATARAFRDHYEQIARGDVPTAVADLGFRSGAVKRALPALRRWDATLRGARIGQLNAARAEAGLAALTDAERAAVPGIADITDIQQWYTAPLDNQSLSPGLEQLLAGNLGGFTRDWRQLPRATRRALWAGASKEALAKGIDHLAFGDIRMIRIGSDEVVLDQRVQKIRDIVELDAPQTGHIRLWQVRPTIGGTDQVVLPGHIDQTTARAFNINNWWTPDLDTAREAYKGLDRASLYYVDVPNNSSVVEPITSGQGARFAEIGEYRITADMKQLRPTRVGSAGEYDIIRGANGKDTLVHRANHVMFGWASHAARAMLKRVPESRFVLLDGANFVPEMERIFDMGFTHSVKQAYIEKMLFAGRGERRTILNRALDHLFAVNGVYSAAGMDSDIVKKYILGQKQMYAANGIDIFESGGARVPTGWLPIAHHADAMQIPDLREMFAQAQRTRLLKTLWGGVNNSMVDTFMGTYWKPSVLLRLAFVPRAAGEEMLAGIMRMNPRGMLGSLAMPKYTVVNGVRERVPFVLLRPMDRLNQWVLSHVPETMHDTHWLNKFTHFIMNFEDPLRLAAGRMMDPVDYKYARLLGTVPAYQRAWAEGMTHVGAGIASREAPGETVNIIKLRRTPDGPETNVRVVMSERQDYSIDSPWYKAFLAGRLDELASDPVGREVVRASMVGMHRDQLDAVANAVAALTKNDVVLNAWVRTYDGDVGALVRDLRGAVEQYGLREHLETLLKVYGRNDPRSLEIARKARTAIEEIVRYVPRDQKLLPTTLVDMFMGKGFANVNVAPREVQAALLVDENAVLGLFGEVPAQDSLEQALKYIEGRKPVQAGYKRVYTSAPDQPALVGTLPTERQTFLDADEAIRTSIYGEQPYHGYNLWYADLDEAEYEQWEWYQSAAKQWRNQQRTSGRDVTGPFDREVEDYVSGLLARFEVVPGYRVPYKGARTTRRAEAERLMIAARSGDEGAAHQLAVLVGKEQLDLMRRDPHRARYFTDNRRAVPSGYNANPVADGYVRVYVPIASPQGMQQVLERRRAASGAFDEGNWLDPGTYQQLVDSATATSLSQFQPMTTWATGSRGDAEEYIAQYGSDVADQLAVGYVDVPQRVVAPSGISLSEMDLWQVAPADTLPDSTARTMEGDETLEDLYRELVAERHAEDLARKARRTTRPLGMTEDGAIQAGPIDRELMGDSQPIPPFSDDLPPLMHGSGSVFAADPNPAYTDPYGLVGQGLYVSDSPGQLQDTYALDRGLDLSDPAQQMPDDYPGGRDAWQRRIIYDQADGPTVYAIRWTGDTQPRVVDLEMPWAEVPDALRADLQDWVYRMADEPLMIEREPGLIQALERRNAVVPEQALPDLQAQPRTLRDVLMQINPNLENTPAAFTEALLQEAYSTRALVENAKLIHVVGFHQQIPWFAAATMRERGNDMAFTVVSNTMDPANWQEFLRPVLNKHGDLWRYDGGVRLAQGDPHNAYILYNTDNIEYMRVSVGRDGRRAITSDDDMNRAIRAQQRLIERIADTAGIEWARSAPAAEDESVQALLRFLENTTDANRLAGLRRAERDVREYREQMRELLRGDAEWTNDEMLAMQDELARREDNLRQFGIEPDDPRLPHIVATRPTSADDLAMDQWAQTIVAGARTLVGSSIDTRVVHELAAPVVSGRVDVTDLAYVTAGQHTPRSVTGPVIYHGEPNKLLRSIDKGFEWINRSISALAREPMYAHMFQLRARQAETAVRELMEDPEVASAMYTLAIRTGRQDNVMLGYKTIYNQLSESLTPDDFDLLVGAVPSGPMTRVTADGAIDLVNDPPWDEPAMYEPLGAIQAREAKNRLLGILDEVDGRIPGLKPKLFADLKAHVRRMDQDDLATFIRWGRAEARIDNQVAAIASEGAVNDMVPYVDDHAVRSQLAEHMRNVAPFWFAEEQFLKRWARTFVHSPEAIRKAALIYQGVREIGFVQQNEYGEDVWVVPGSALLTDILGDVAEAITGDPYTIPVKMPFTGAVRWSLPGLTAPGQPSFGPVVGIPMTLLARRFPELNQVGDVVLQEGQTQRSIIDQLLPVSVKRFYDALAKDRKDTQYAAAMVSAMQYLEATGNGVGPDASTDEMDEYLDRIENWTRVMLLSKAMFGFVSPAPPVLAKPDDLAPELRTLLQNLPFEDALAEFMRRNPDATAYTVFKTESPSGASMATSERVGKWLDQNSEFVANHRLAVPWLLPQGIQEASNDAELSVFYRQIKAKLRQRKEPKEWLIDYAFAAAAPQYFASRDKYELARIQYKNDPIALRKLDDGWRAWKDKYYKQFPLFAEQLQSRDAHNRRVRVLGEVREALRDPNLPDGIEHKTELTSMVNSYYTFDSAMSALRGDRTGRASDQRAALRTTFAEWGRLFIKENPHLRAFWMRNIEPEIGLSFEQQNNLDRAA